jgi:hypothetical protein
VKNGQAKVISHFKLISMSRCQIIWCLECFKNCFANTTLLEEIYPIEREQIGYRQVITLFDEIAIKSEDIGNNF